MQNNKTRLIAELLKEPVARDNRRIHSPRPTVRIVEESETIEDIGEEQERYRFELMLTARFVNRPTPDFKRQREQQYRLLLRSITEHVYNDVRQLAFEMYPLVADCTDWKLREKLTEKIEEILDMTVPE